MQTPLTSQLCEDGVRSSYFLPVKISMATKWHFACPCLPVFDVETSATCKHRFPKSLLLVDALPIHSLLQAATYLLQNGQTSACQ